MDLKDLRLNYKQGRLDEEDAPGDPYDLFTLWFEQARTAGNPEPNAMALATASAAGVPNVRIVLLKGVDPQTGFVWYTNYESRKGAELAENPRAALLFYWPELERQVRIQGSVSLVSREEAEAYFATRPTGHRLGAWASKQSSVVSGREVLERNMAAAEERFQSVDTIPLPPFWGGYRLQPDNIEFWQGRSNRLHDRLEYVRGHGGTPVMWERRRLSP